MAEKPEIKLDLKDREILYQLDLNARQSNSQIAKKLRLNKNIVNYRINRLEKLGIIQSYSAIIDFTKLGFFLFRVYIDFYEFDVNKERELLDYLIKEPYVGGLVKAVGDYDIVADFYAKNFGSFQKNFNECLNKFRNIIKIYDIELVLKDMQIVRKYLIQKEDKDIFNKPHIFEIGGNFPEKIDKTDLEIISLLISNARTSIIEMASKLKITSMAVIHRVKQLLKRRIILGYRTNLNINKLNYSRYRISFELNDTTILNELINYCQHNPNIILITSSIQGNVDFRVDIEVNNFELIINLINDLKVKFPEKIRNYKYFRFAEFYKKDKIPSI